MDETTLRTVLDGALVHEPPIGPVAQNALRAGIKLRRRRRVLGVAGSVAATAAIAVAIPAVTGRPSPGQGQQAAAAASFQAAAEAAARNKAAAWVADQVSDSAVVSCDPVMCQALKAHRFPAGQLRPLRQAAPYPLASSLVVSTAVVRSQFGSNLALSSPAVLASFGSGAARVDIRAVSPAGAAAYRSALSADVQARKRSGAELLLHSKRIAFSATARRQLIAGQVDSRLIRTVANLASLHLVTIVAFGDASPGASPGIPLRSADLAETGGPPLTRTSPYVLEVLNLLSSMQAPYRPATVALVPSAGGQKVLRIEFTAPSPLGLNG
jgi:hypothetical protein